MDITRSEKQNSLYRDHSFSTYGKFSKKMTSLSHWRGEGGGVNE